MVSAVLHGILDLLWPPRTACLLCNGALGGEPLVCSTCWASMRFPVEGDRCRHCGRPMKGPGERCEECAGGTPFSHIYALGLHEGPLREAIHHLKFGGRHQLGDPLGRKLAAEISHPPGYVVAVPLHPSRLRERGYNQAALVAEGLADALGVRFCERGLIRTRRTGHQAKLDREARLHNLQGAFAAERGAGAVPWAQRSVLLVDDVLTTGATAAAVASVLKETGAATVDLAVLAVSATPIRPA